MTGGLDEVDAGVHTVVNNLLTVNPVFLLEVRVETRFNVIENRLPAIQRVRAG